MNIKTKIKIQVKILYAVLVVLKNELLSKLSKFVAWISRPENFSEIGVLSISFNAWAFAFAPINTTLLSNSLTSKIIDFFYDLSNLTFYSNFLKRIQEWFT